MNLFNIFYNTAWEIGASLVHLSAVPACNMVGAAFSFKHLQQILDSCSAPPSSLVSPYTTLRGQTLCGNYSRGLFCETTVVLPVPPDPQPQLWRPGGSETWLEWNSRSLTTSAAVPSIILHKWLRLCQWPLYQHAVRLANDAILIWCR